MSKKVAILVAEGFEQVEFTEPKKALEAAGAETVVISLQDGQVRGFNHHDPGDQFPVDLKVSEAREEDFDALLLPGGVINPDGLRGDKHAVEFARSFFQADKPVFVICHGPQLLITANVVKGRKITSFHTVRVDLENAGANWEDKSVVVDGKLVSSRNPDDISDFNKEIVRHL